MVMSFQWAKYAPECIIGHMVTVIAFILAQSLAHGKLRIQVPQEVLITVSSSV